MSQRGTGVAEPDRVFDALSHPYRRRIMALVGEEDAPEDVELDIDDLVTAADDAERQLLALHHTHLPKLEDGGYVTWDRNRRTIRRGDRFGDVASFIRLIQNNPDHLPGVWP